jgi:hypothetical protein
LLEAAAAGKLDGTGALKASMKLEIAALGLVHVIDGEIAIE